MYVLKITVAIMYMKRYIATETKQTKINEFDLSYISRIWTLANPEEERVHFTCLINTEMKIKRPMGLICHIRTGNLTLISCQTSLYLHINSARGKLHYNPLLALAINATRFSY